MSQILLPTTNADLSKTGDCEKKPVLQWYADPDGVHRLREGRNQNKFPCRATVSETTLDPGNGWMLEWWAFAADYDFEDPTVDDKARSGNFHCLVDDARIATLELAKAAAERAVEGMDEEGEK